MVKRFLLTKYGTNRIVRTIAISIACSLTLLPAIASNMANEWTPPISISAQLVGPSQLPNIAHDSEGRLHVSWVEKSYVERGEADAVYYSYFDGNTWSYPVDVLVSPDQGNIVTGELVALPSDKLALLWIGANHLQFSQVFIGDAQRANAWKTTTLFPWLLARTGFMYFSPPTTLHVLLVGDVQNEVIYSQSTDSGNTWMDPVTVWSPQSNSYAGNDPRLCIDDAGLYLHAVWHENARDLDWNPNGIWYSRSEDQGHTWSDAEFLANRGSSPNCAYDGDGRLHMLWNNAVGSVDGRYHRWSTDEGYTWSDPVPIFPGLSGRTRAPALRRDGSGTLHVLTGAMFDGATRMLWSYWQDENWTSPQSISDDLVSNESPDLTVTSGNTLNAVWHYGNDDMSQIWFAAFQTDVPSKIESAESEPLMRLPLAPTEVPAPTPSPLPLPTQPPPPLDSLPDIDSNPAVHPLVVGVLPVLGLLAVVLGWRITRTRRF
jgi:hypothetical protein